MGTTAHLCHTQSAAQGNLNCLRAGPFSVGMEFAAPAKIVTMATETQVMAAP